MFRAINIPRKEGNSFVKIEYMELRFAGLPEIKDRTANAGYPNTLEISSKSESQLGKSLSAFNLKTLSPDGQTRTIECLYQGSKVFENAGPFHELYNVSPRDAKTDKRLKKSGRLIGFDYFGKPFPLNPNGSFYNWLYINALRKKHDIFNQLSQFDGFTDVFYDPRNGNNCQAFSCALFVSMVKSGFKGSISESIAGQVGTYFDWQD